MDNQNNRLDNEESEDEAPETQELKDLSTILRSNVFPGIYSKILACTAQSVQYKCLLEHTLNR